MIFSCDCDKKVDQWFQTTKTFWIIICVNKSEAKELTNRCNEVANRNQQLENEYQAKLESLYKRLIDPKTKRISLSSNHVSLCTIDLPKSDQSQSSNNENSENHNLNSQPVDWGADTEFREMKQRLSIATEQNDLLRQAQVRCPLIYSNTQFAFHIQNICCCLFSFFLESYIWKMKQQSWTCI